MTVHYQTHGSYQAIIQTHGSYQAIIQIFVKQINRLLIHIVVYNSKKNTKQLELLILGYFKLSVLQCIQ